MKEDLKQLSEGMSSAKREDKLSEVAAELAHRVYLLYSNLMGMRDRLKWRNRLRRKIERTGKAYWSLDGESEEQVIDRLKRYDESSRIKQFFWRSFTNIEEQRKMLVCAKALDVLVGIGNHSELLNSENKDWLMRQKNRIHKKELKKVVVDMEGMYPQFMEGKGGNWSLLNRVLGEQIVRLEGYKQQLLKRLGKNEREMSGEVLISKWRKEVEDYQRSHVIVRWFKRRYSRIELKTLLISFESAQELLQRVKQGGISWHDYQWKWKELKQEWRGRNIKFPGVNLLKEVDHNLKASLSMIKGYLEINHAGMKGPNKEKEMKMHEGEIVRRQIEIFKTTLLDRLHICMYMVMKQSSTEETIREKFQEQLSRGVEDKEWLLSSIESEQEKQLINDIFKEWQLDLQTLQGWSSEIKNLIGLFQTIKQDNQISKESCECYGETIGTGYASLITKLDAYADGKWLRDPQLRIFEPLWKLHEKTLAELSKKELIEENSLVSHRYRTHEALFDLFSIDGAIEKSQQDLFVADFKIDYFSYMASYDKNSLKLINVIESYKDKQLSFEAWQEVVLKDPLVQTLDKELEKQRNKLSKKYHPDRLKKSEQKYQEFFSKIQRLYSNWQEAIKFIKVEDRDVEESLVSVIIILHQQGNQKGIQDAKDLRKRVLEGAQHCCQVNLEIKELLLASVRKDKETKTKIEIMVQKEEELLKKYIELKKQLEGLEEESKKDEENNKRLKEESKKLKEGTNDLKNENNELNDRMNNFEKLLNQRKKEWSEDLGEEKRVKGPAEENKELTDPSNNKDADFPSLTRK